MFKSQGGSSVTIQGIECHLPPLPQKHEILNYGLSKKEQKWIRPELPSFRAREIDIFDGTEYKPNDEISFDEAVRQEEIGITGCDPYDLDKQGNPKRVHGVTPNSDYVSESLEAFRAQELERVFNGVYVYINGKPVYLTGVHYLYLTYWFLDGIYAEFRITDLEFFYVIEVVRHPECAHLGLYYITRRGQGKSYRAAVVLYHTIIRKKYGHAGIQSKTDDDAEAFFKTKILQPMTKLPKFLIPINTHKGDITQVKKLEFAPPARKGMDARLYNKLKKEALYSFVDYRSSGESAYDSATLCCKLDDELAKLDPKKIADAEVRLQTNIFCVLRGVDKKGFILATSTVEAYNCGGKQAKAIWDKSDQGKLNKNGRTISGLVRMFSSCLDDTYFDEYGYSLREKAKTYHDAEREKFEDDVDGLVGYKQKNPYTFDEAFHYGGVKCIYNSQILYAAKNFIANTDRKLTRRGDFVWKIKDKEAQFVDNEINGRWEVSYLPDNCNEVKIQAGQRPTFSPVHSSKRVCGMDPFANSNIADDNKGSFGAAAIYNKFDFNIPEELCDTFIAIYKYRAATVEECMEDILTGCFFYSCPILLETNKGGDSAKSYAKLRGYKWGYDSNPDDFILEQPESTMSKSAQSPGEGLYMTEGVKIQYTNATATHVVKHGHKLKFNTIIDELLEYDPKATKKFDVAVAVGLALIAAESKVSQPKPEIDLSNIFKTWNNTGSMSTMYN